MKMYLTIEGRLNEEDDIWKNDKGFTRKTKGVDEDILDREDSHTQRHKDG